MAITSYEATATGGAAHTKGAYVQVVAATPSASSRLYLLLRASSGVRTPMLVDLATGAPSAETVVVANVAMYTDADGIVGELVALDLDVSAGTRLAVRCQSATVSATCQITVLLDDRPLGGLAPPVTYGADTSTSRGTSLDPGIVASTKGSYVQLSASTSARIDAVVICCTHSTTNISTSIIWKIDLATGAAGAEALVIQNLGYTAGNNGDAVRPQIVRVPVAIPAGTRLAVRAQSTSTAVERLLCVTLIGLQDPASTGGSAAGAVAYVG